MWDTSGQEELENIRTLSYEKTDVFLFCFSLVRPETLYNIERIYIREVQEYCPDKPYLLVGIESELRDDFDTKSDELKAQGLSPVSKEEGQRMADKIHACCYIECSFSKFINVNEVFHNAVKIALGQDKPVESEGGNCEVF